jgi:hypothetical protein
MLVYVILAGSFCDLPFGWPWSFLCGISLELSCDVRMMVSWTVGRVSLLDVPPCILKLLALVGHASEPDRIFLGSAVVSSVGGWVPREYKMFQVANSVWVRGPLKRGRALRRVALVRPGTRFICRNICRRVEYSAVCDFCKVSVRLVSQCMALV